MRISHPLWELTKARLLELVRDRSNLFWIFSFPMLIGLVLGVAFHNRGPEEPSIALVGVDRHPAIQALLDSERLEAKLMDAATARSSLARSAVDAVVEAVDGAITLSYDATAERAQLARVTAIDVIERALGRRDVVQVAENVVVERGSLYIDYLLPGLIGLNVMSSSMWGVGYTIVVARKRRLLRRYAVVPMRRSHYLMSYFLGRALLLLLEVAALSLFGYVVFGTTLKGSVASLVGVAAVGAAAFSGISLLVTARMTNVEAANGWINLTQMPMFVLSGLFFSYERFPEWTHSVLRLLPLTALNDALRSVYTDGASLLATSDQVLVLGAWAGLGFLASSRVFLWQ